MNIKPQQLEKMQSAQGFIAALDQSGGSTPKALENYGIAGKVLPLSIMVHRS